MMSLSIKKIGRRKLSSLFLSCFLLIYSTSDSFGVGGVSFQSPDHTVSGNLATESFFAHHKDELLIKTSIIVHINRDPHFRVPFVTTLSGKEIAISDKRASRETGGFLITCEIEDRKYMAHVKRSRDKSDQNLYGIDVHVYGKEEMESFLRHQSAKRLLLSSVNDHDRVAFSPDHAELSHIFSFFNGIDQGSSPKGSKYTDEREGTEEQVRKLAESGKIFYINGYESFPPESIDHASTPRVQVKHRDNDEDMGIAILFKLLEKFGIPGFILYSDDVKKLIEREYRFCREGSDKFNPQKLINFIYFVTEEKIDLTRAKFVNMETFRGRNFGQKDLTASEREDVVMDLSRRIEVLMKSMRLSGKYDNKKVYSLEAKLYDLVDHFSYHQVGNVLSGIANIALPDTTDSVGSSEESIFANFGWLTAHRVNQVLGLEFDMMPLVSAHFHPSEACNHQCETCMYARPTDKRLRMLEQGIIDERDIYSNIDVAKQVIDVLRENGTDEIIFTGGGEPLMAHQGRVVVEGMRYAKASGLEVVLYTNGVLLDEDKIDAILDIEPRFVRISLNAVTPDIYGRFHGTHKASRERITERVKKNLEYLCRAKELRRQKGLVGGKTEVSVGVVVSPVNYQDLVNIAAYMRDLAASGYAPDRIVFRPVNNSITTGRITEVERESEDWIDINAPRWYDAFYEFMHKNQQFPEDFWKEVLSIIEDEEVFPETVPGLGLDGPVKGVLAALLGTGIQVSYTKGRFISAGRSLPIKKCLASPFAAPIDVTGGIGFCVELGGDDKWSLGNVYRGIDLYSIGSARQEKLPHLYDEDGTLICTQTCMVHEYNVVYNGIVGFSEEHNEDWTKLQRLIKLIISQKEILLISEEKEKCEVARAEAYMINHKNLGLDPELKEDKIVCHVISDSIFLNNEIAKDLVEKLEIATRKSDKYREKIVHLDYGNGEDPIEALSRVMEYWVDYYVSLGYAREDIEFDVACSNAILAERIRKEKDGVHAMAFKAGEGNYVQVEAIVLLLRALRRYYEDSMAIDDFKNLCNKVTGYNLSEKFKEINDMEEFLNKLVITLPSFDLLIEDARELSEIVRKSILSAV